MLWGQQAKLARHYPVTGPATPEDFPISTIPASDSSSKLAALAMLARMDRPVGTLLLLWPTLGALWAASEGIPAPTLIVAFALGTFLMRSAGCIANDMADRNLDLHVARTQNRPLATGAVSLKEATAALLVLLLLSAATLLLLNHFTKALSLVGLLLAMTYPFFKRFTYLPQVPLGAAFSWGIIMAFAAVQETVPSAAWLLFIGSVLWIVAYDTQYAMVDREDDLKVGIRSTAILFGNGDRLAIFFLQLAALTVFLLFGQRSGYQLFYFLGLGAMGLLFLYQQRLIRKREPAACFDAFKNNVWAGFALFLGIAFEVQFAPLMSPAE